VVPHESEGPPARLKVLRKTEVGKRSGVLRSGHGRRPSIATGEVVELKKSVAADAAPMLPATKRSQMIETLFPEPEEIGPQDRSAAIEALFTPTTSGEEEDLEPLREQEP
jgi:hypothetical protein